MDSIGVRFNPSTVKRRKFEIVSNSKTVFCINFPGDTTYSTIPKYDNGIGKLIEEEKVVAEVEISELQDGDLIGDKEKENDENIENVDRPEDEAGTESNKEVDKDVQQVGSDLYSFGNTVSGSVQNDSPSVAEGNAG